MLSQHMPRTWSDGTGTLTRQLEQVENDAPSPAPGHVIDHCDSEEVDAKDIPPARRSVDEQLLLHDSEQAEILGDSHDHQRSVSVYLAQSLYSARSLSPLTKSNVKDDSAGPEGKALIVRQDQAKRGPSLPPKANRTAVPDVPLTGSDLGMASLAFVRRLFAKDYRVKDSSRALSNRIRQAQVHTYEYHVKFVPCAKIEQLVSQRHVQLELEKHNGKVDPSFSKVKGHQQTPVTIQGDKSYVKILTILSLYKRPSKIRNFVQCGVSDADLPLDRKIGPKGVSFLRSRQDSTAQKLHLSKVQDETDFIKYQWRVLSPKFSLSNDNRIHRHRFSEEVILPFLTRDRVSTTGSFGTVYKVRIHADHDALYGTDKASQHVYAVKSLDSIQSRTKEPDTKHDPASARETKTLEKLSHKRHSHLHLTTLLGTYIQGGVHHLILPYAEKNLFEFWQSLPKPKREIARSTWVFEQCMGLVEALKEIHRYHTTSKSSLQFEKAISPVRKRSESKREQKGEYINDTDDDVDGKPYRLFGRHGDIKPENILWFPGTTSTNTFGVLKIADFGITTFSRTDQFKDDRLPCSPSYRAPEYDLEKELSTASDVWALGCVYLQFVVWYMCGFERIRSFGERRLAIDPKWEKIRTDTFFRIVQSGGCEEAEVKESVSQMMDELLNRRDCEETMKALLTMARDHMLVVNQWPRARELIEHATREEHYPRKTDTPSFQASAPPRRRRRSCGEIHSNLSKLRPNYTGYDVGSRRNTLETLSEVS